MDGIHAIGYIETIRNLPEIVDMKYAVVIEESEEGFAVSVPGLPGCYTQGSTKAEALENASDAIREYLEVTRELARSRRKARPQGHQIQG